MPSAAVWSNLGYNMSIEYVRAVAELDQRVTGLARYLLTVIAEHADERGLAWPGNECLARETTISERQIRRLLPQLEHDGLIQTVQTGNGRGHRRIIRLLFTPARLTKRGTIEQPGPAKGDNMTPIDQQKGDIQPPFSLPNPDVMRPERGTNATIKGDMRPEKTGDNPMNPNNNPKKAGREDLDPVIAAPAVVEPVKTAPTPTRPTPPRPPLTVPKSPHLDPRKFKGGYIADGKGSTAVEVWYESFSIHDLRWRLSAPLEDDLTRHCPDLDRLRQVLKAYRQHGQYAPRNLKLTFDWYDQGVPNRGGKAPERKKNESDYDFSGYQPQLIVNGPPA